MELIFELQRGGISFGEGNRIALSNTQQCFCAFYDNRLWCMCVIDLWDISASNIKIIWLGFPCSPN